MIFSNIEIDDVQLNKDIKIIDNYPIDIICNNSIDLFNIKIKDLRFSENQLLQRRLTKVSDELFNIIFKHATDNMVEKISIFIEDKYFNTNEVIKIYKEIGMAVGILAKICVGNLICDSEDNQYRVLYEKYIESVRKEIANV